MIKNIRYPSVKALEGHFMDDASWIRETLKTKGLDGLDEPSKGFFGKERVCYENGKWAFSYVNTGDTYNPTIVWTGKSYILTTMGDMVETIERRGRKVY